MKDSRTPMEVVHNDEEEVSGDYTPRPHRRSATERRGGFSPSSLVSFRLRSDSLNNVPSPNRAVNASKSLRSTPMQRKSALQERLHHIVVFELLAGNQKPVGSDPDAPPPPPPPGRFRTMRLRDLYNYIQKNVSGGNNTDPSLTSPDITAGGKRLGRRRSTSYSGSPSGIPGLPLNPSDSPGGSDMPPFPSEKTVLGGYLHPRDMRRMVTPFSASNQPALIVRRHVMLLNFDPLRAVVLRDRLLLLVPDGADSILTQLEKSIRGGLSQTVDEVFGDSENGNGKEGATSPVETTIKKSMSFVLMRKKADELNLNLQSLRNLRPGGPEKMGNKTNGGDIAGDNNADSGDHDDDHDDGDDSEEEFSIYGNEDRDGGVDMPFELVCLDSVLHSASAILQEDFVSLSSKVYDACDALRGDHGQGRVVRSSQGHMNQSQERLRVLKNEISVLENRVSGFVRAMDEVLDEDEDLALMNLSRLITAPHRFIQPVSPQVLEEEGDEPELILEAYEQQGLSTANNLKLLRNQVTATEELVMMSLDAIRNRLLAYNTLLSLISACVASASLVGSIFGMNLTSGLEDSENAFNTVVIATMSCTGAVLIVLSYFFYRNGVM